MHTPVNATLTIPSPALTAWSLPSSAWLCTILAIYLVFVRMLRYRRVRALERERAKVEKLTPAQAQKIIQAHFQWDMPFIAEKALTFALFKTYGVPTISSLLHQTKELADPKLASKRYVDTAVLISTWMTCPISGPGSGASESCQAANDQLDPRSAIAVARTNWIHAHYPSISNDDFLYTLSVFILEPVRWAEQYEWRSLGPVEQEALYIFWTEIGRRMGIRDIPPSFNDLQEWSEAYEREAVVPNEITAVVGEQTIALILYHVPEAFGLKALGRNIVYSFLDERLRNAMLLPRAHPLVKKTVSGILRVRAFLIRNFFLPRSSPSLFVELDPKVKPGQMPPRMHPVYYNNAPWYFPERTGVRKLLEKVMVALGLARPDIFPGPKYLSQGYRLEEMGPSVFTKAAHEKVMKMAEEMQGAPVTGPWSLNYAGGCPMTGAL